MDTRDFLVPDNYADFHCKCGQCRHTCCDGWAVTFPREDYFRLLSVPCSPELRRKLDTSLHLADDPTPERYAELLPNWEGHCPLQRADGLCALQAECGEEALQKLQENPDTKLCLLDIMLPDIDGFEVCRRIRMSNAQVGIIMLTARTQEMDKVTGLMTGADDYVTKPFSPAELTARVDALLRRMGENTPATHTGELYQPPFLLNLTNRTLEKNGERVKLTQLEYSIVKLFMENRGKALAREEILDAVWGRGYFGELKIVDVNVRRLRLKIEDDAQEPKYISTVWGFGYKWTV